MNYVIYVVVVLLALAAAVVSVNKWEGRIETRGYDRGIAEWAVAKVKETKLARDEETRRQAEKAKIENENKIKLAQAEAVARSERSAATELRVRLTTLATAGRTSTSGSGLVLGGSPIERIGAVAGECVVEYQKLAEAARRANLAGRTCEASYDSLTLTMSKTINPRPPPATTKAAVPNSNLSGDSK